MYLGKPKDGERQVCLGRQVIEQLNSKLRGTFGHIYCDNYFSSPKLCHSLMENGLYCYGTIKSNCEGLREEVCSKKKLNALIKYGGDYAQFLKDGLLVSAWREKKGQKQALVALTNTGPAVGPITIQHKQKNVEVLNVPCVEPVVEYNAWMNALDHSDQMYNTYR